MGLFNVRPGLSRVRLFGGCSLLCLTLGMAHPTQASERRNPKSEDSFYERFHVSLEGGWLTNVSPDNFAFSGDLAASGSLNVAVRVGVVVFGKAAFAGVTSAGTLGRVVAAVCWTYEFASLK